MYITKSLFVEFCSSPKLARWHINNKDTYKSIQEDKYWAMDGVTIGQTVEDMVLECFPDKEITEIDTENMRSNRHQTYHDRTMKALESDPEILYQPSFLIDDLFVKCDILVRNDIWTYDLIEVKAKNGIRKTTKAEPLLDDLIADVSIQRLVLKRVLKEKFSGKCFLAYLDKTYEKQGSIDPKDIIIQEEISSELLEDANIETILTAIREKISLSEEEFNTQYPYDGSDYLTYFGVQPPKQSIWSISWCSAKKKVEFYNNNKFQLDDLHEVDTEFLKKANWDSSKSSQFLELRKQWPQSIDTSEVWSKLNSLQFPLYFYDYETISRPKPIFNWTNPWQQVVVQYSLHKMEKDGTITHYEWLLEDGSFSSRRSIPGETDTNKKLLDQMIDHMDGVWQGTRIVWNQGFENARNNERWKQFPEYADALKRINDATFDLMEIFKKQLFFHRDFEWSASIKKVLPVLTEISYDNLEVPNGWIASNLLRLMMMWEVDDRGVDKIHADLLEYCKQDTWAMVRIYQEVLKALE